MGERCRVICDGLRMHTSFLAWYWSPCGDRGTVVLFLLLLPLILIDKGYSCRMSDWIGDICCWKSVLRWEGFLLSNLSINSSFPHRKASPYVPKPSNTLPFIGTLLLSRPLKVRGQLICPYLTSFKGPFH